MYPTTGQPANPELGTIGTTTALAGSLLSNTSGNGSLGLVSNYALPTSSAALNLTTTAMGSAQIMAAFGLLPRVFDPFSTSMYHGLSAYQAARTAQQGTFAAVAAAGSSGLLAATPYLAGAFLVNAGINQAIEGARESSMFNSVASGSYAGSGMNLGPMSSSLSQALGNAAYDLSASSVLYKPQDIAMSMMYGMQNSVFKGTTDVINFQSQLKDLHTSLTGASRVTGLRGSELYTSINSMGQLGYHNFNDRVNVLGATVALQKSIGLDVGSAFDMMSSYGSAALHSGGSRTDGAATGLLTAGKLQLARNTGMLSRDEFDRIGGLQFDQRARSGASSFLGSLYGQEMLYAALDEEGNIDSTMASRISSGRVSYSEISKLATKKKEQFGLYHIMSNFEELSSDLINSAGAGGVLKGMSGYLQGRFKGSKGRASALEKQLSGLSEKDLDLVEDLDSMGPILDTMLQNAVRQSINEVKHSTGGAKDIMSRIVDRVVQPVQRRLRDMGRSVHNSVSTYLSELEKDLKEEKHTFQDSGTFMGQHQRAFMGFSEMITDFSSIGSNPFLDPTGGFNLANEGGWSGRFDTGRKTDFNTGLGEFIHDMIPESMRAYANGASLSDIFSSGYSNEYSYASAGLAANALMRNPAGRLLGSIHGGFWDANKRFAAKFPAKFMGFGGRGVVGSATSLVLKSGIASSFLAKTAARALAGPLGTALMAYDVLQNTKPAADFHLGNTMNTQGAIGGGEAAILAALGQDRLISMNRTTGAMTGLLQDRGENVVPLLGDFNTEGNVGYLDEWRLIDEKMDSSTSSRDATIHRNTLRGRIADPFADLVLGGSSVGDLVNFVSSNRRQASIEAAEIRAAGLREVKKSFGREGEQYSVNVDARLYDTLKDIASPIGDNTLMADLATGSRYTTFGQFKEALGSETLMRLKYDLGRGENWDSVSSKLDYLSTRTRAVEGSTFGAFTPKDLLGRMRILGALDGSVGSLISSLSGRAKLDYSTPEKLKEAITSNIHSSVKSSYLEDRVAEQDPYDFILFSWETGNSVTSTVDTWSDTDKKALDLIVQKGMNLDADTLKKISSGEGYGKFKLGLLDSIDSSVSGMEGFNTAVAARKLLSRDIFKDDSVLKWMHQASQYQKTVSEFTHHVSHTFKPAFADFEKQATNLADTFKVLGLSDSSLISIEGLADVYGSANTEELGGFHEKTTTAANNLRDSIMGMDPEQVERLMTMAQTKSEAGGGPIWGTVYATAQAAYMAKVNLFNKDTLGPNLKNKQNFGVAMLGDTKEVRKILGLANDKSSYGTYVKDYMQKTGRLSEVQRQDLEEYRIQEYVTKFNLSPIEAKSRAKFDVGLISNLVFDKGGATEAEFKGDSAINQALVQSVAVGVTGNSMGKKESPEVAAQKLGEFTKAVEEATKKLGVLAGKGPSADGSIPE